MIKKLKLSLILLLLNSTLFAQTEWRQEFQNNLSLLGHRNWILVVDAAYPYQSKAAIQTIVTQEDHLDVVEEVLEAIKKAPHINPEIFLDKEIDFVPDDEAKGMERYRRQLYKILDDNIVTKTLHEELISEVDEAAEVFHILVLKTNMTLPYTSVFFRLDCGYWNTDQETKMRDRMKKGNNDE